MPEIRVPKLALVLFSAVLMFLANFHVGFEVTVGDWTSAGIFSPHDLLQSVKLCEALASDILGEDVDISGMFSVKVRLVSGDYSPEVGLLQRELLDAVPGIARYCAVYVDGRRVGWVAEASVLGEVLQDILAQECTPNTVSSGFNEEISFKYSFAREQTPIGIAGLTEAILENVTIYTMENYPSDANVVDGIVYPR